MRASLSTLTGDCLLKVFSFLHLKDLNSMSYSNRRMRELARSQMVRSKKRRPIRLRIVQIDKAGYVFNLFHGYETHQDNYLLAVDYDGSEAVRVKYNGGLAKNYRKLLLDHGGSYVTSDLSIPSPFIEELEQLLQWYSLGGLALRNIRITSSCMDFLERTVHDVNRLEFFGCKVDDDCVERLSDFILNQQVLSMQIKNSELSLSSIPNEDFLKRLTINGSKMLDLQIQTSSVVTKHFRFIPSKGILNYLTSFEVVNFPSLILDVQWIPELFEKLLKLRLVGQMIIGVTRKPATWNFGAFPRLWSYRIRNNPDYDHGVENISVGSSARFKTTRQGNSFVLCADFETEGRWDR